MICPSCQNEMKWQEGLLIEGSGDDTLGRYYCLFCRIFAMPEESRAITKGRKMAHELIGVAAMDKKITSQSCSTQVGILRERQHCATCNSYSAKPCECKGCDCLYCREYKGK